MTWGELKIGHRVVIRGVVWECIAHDGPRITLRNPLNGQTFTGTPDPTTPVELAVKTVQKPVRQNDTRRGLDPAERYAVALLHNHLGAVPLDVWIGGGRNW